MFTRRLKRPRITQKEEVDDFFLYTDILGRVMSEIRCGRLHFFRMCNAKERKKEVTDPTRKTTEKYNRFQ